MSKQSEAKASQNWKKKPDTCAECAHFKCDREEIRYSEFSSQVWIREKNLRCTLGGFKTGKSNACDRFKAKDA